MAEHSVEISDSNGKAIRVKVSLPPVGAATWEIESLRFLRLQKGVVDSRAERRPVDRLLRWARR